MAHPVKLPSPQEVQAAREQLREAFEEMASGSPTEFIEEWEARKSEHLPLSLTVLCDPEMPIHQESAEPPRGIASAVWRAHCRYRESENKTLLLVTGFSPEQVVLSMALHVTAFGCRRVIPVSTRYAWGKSSDGQQLQNWWAALCEARKSLPPWEQLVAGNSLLEVHEGSPSDIFKKIRAWLKLNPGPCGNIAIDATGGTKPMDSGASACAAYYDLPAYYIHTTGYHSDLRRPPPHSATYSVLDRPFSTFSHAGREAVLHAFKNRDFRLAGALTRELSQQMKEDGEFGDYFDDADRDACGALMDLIDRCRDWLRLGYCSSICHSSAAESLSASETDPLQQPATEAGEPQIEAFLRYHASKATEPRQVIRTLREHSRSQGGWQLSMEYFVSEYYRLCSLMGRDPAQAFADGTGTEPDSVENVREVVTVGYGLAECVLDSILYLPACWRRMHVQWSGQDPTIAAGDPATRDKLFEWGWISPDPDFLRLSYDRKVQMLLGNKGTFKDVRAIKADMPTTCENGDLQKVVSLASSDTREGLIPLLRGVLPKREEQLESKVTVRLRTGQTCKPAPLIKGGDQSAWSRLLGIPESEWAEARNAITHVRIPLTQTTIDIARRAMQEYLPRMIELYYRIAAVQVDERGSEIEIENGQPTLPLRLRDATKEDWVTWRQNPRWRARRFLPWVDRSGDVRKWLGLEL